VIAANVPAAPDRRGDRDQRIRLQLGAAAQGDIRAEAEAGQPQRCRMRARTQAATARRSSAFAAAIVETAGRLRRCRGS
jgi:hypothetical protein